MTTVISFVLGMMFGGAVGIIMAAVLMASREDLPSAEPETIRCKDCKYGIVRTASIEIQRNAPCIMKNGYLVIMMDILRAILLSMTER